MEEGDVAIGIKRKKTDELDPTVVFEVDKSLRVPKHVRGRVVDASVRSRIVTSGGAPRELRVASVQVAVKCPIQVGDKLSGRHGNKGIVSKIVDTRDMPILPDGTPVDICLNPLGVPSRMNVGQIFEALLGLAGRWTGQEYRVAPFDEMFAESASEGMVFDALRRAKEGTGNVWLLDPSAPGKMRLYDGCTGQLFEQPVTVGVTYIIKLYHMVRDKIAARAVGKYSTLTQQPPRGKVRQGGQRLGEMEVSAFVGYGAQAALQEMLTIKSDDVAGREAAKRAMWNGEPVKFPLGATSEGYLTFQREMCAAGFAVEEGSFIEEAG